MRTGWAIVPEMKVAGMPGDYTSEKTFRRVKRYMLMKEKTKGHAASH